MTDREELERRLLALVRDFLIDADGHYPYGFEVEDFALIFQIRFAPDEENLKPWHAGPHPGWHLGVAYVSSAESLWQDEALLTEALERIRERRLEVDGFTWESKEDASEDD